MNATAIAAKDPKFEGPVRASLGGFSFERRGAEVTIQAGGRSTGLSSHMFMRTIYRMLAHGLALGKSIFYGGFCIHNLGDPVQGEEVKFSILGSPAVEEVRRFLTQMYEDFKWDGYEEWY